MLLARKEILKAIEEKRVIIEPRPEDADIDTTSIDLRIGAPLWVWKSSPIRGHTSVIDLRNFDYREFARENLSEVATDPEGGHVIQPHTVYLSVTQERVQFPGGSNLAGRLEGKSSLARLGLMVHMTAPLIHAGTALAEITLEIVNLGPYPIRVQPGATRICQLLLEEVSSAPEDRKGRTFPE